MVLRSWNCAKEQVEGDCTDQYTRLYDYAAELQKTNDGSTVLLKVDAGQIQES